MMRGGVLPASDGLVNGTSMEGQQQHTENGYLHNQPQPTPTPVPTAPAAVYLQETNGVIQKPTNRPNKQIGWSHPVTKPMGELQKTSTIVGK